MLSSLCIEQQKNTICVCTPGKNMGTLLHFIVQEQSSPKENQTHIYMYMS